MVVASIVLAALGISAGLAIFGSGYALAKAAPASIALLGEKPEQFFKGFLVVTLCEALAIYGLVLGMMVLLGV
jgi:F0F1-type ATP synthase membrane subunit c/vacuolar-type H+-ATPase subunit K